MLPNMTKLSVATITWLDKNEQWLLPFLRKVERLAPANNPVMIYIAVWLVAISAPFLLSGLFLPKTPLVETLRIALYVIWLIALIPVIKAVMQPFAYWRYTRMK